MFNYKIITVAFFLALAAGCTSPTVPDPDATDSIYGDEGESGEQGYGVDEMGMGEGEFFDDSLSGGELGNVIYFDFDSSEVGAEYADVVARHAMQLADNPQARVRLEGHADERGSREYNIGLGERRSQAVRRMLLIQGATSSQISTVSFGEERPVALGSAEEDYSQNRRVEIMYTN